MWKYNIPFNITDKEKSTLYQFYLQFNIKWRFQDGRFSIETIKETCVSTSV